MTDSTLDLWNAVCKTDPKFTKKFQGKGGFTGTAICAQWQRYKATELWGPFGAEWNVRDESYDFVTISDDKREALLVYTGTLNYPGGSIGLKSEIDVWTYSRKGSYWSKNNDIHKKVSTDALTKGLSTLGFSADVFMGKFDDNKYIEKRREEVMEDRAKDNSSDSDAAPNSEWSDTDKVDCITLARVRAKALNKPDVVLAGREILANVLEVMGYGAENKPTGKDIPLIKAAVNKFEGAP